MKIKTVRALEVLDSRGNPTVAVEVTLSEGTRALAMVPSGASKAKAEALEKRDSDLSRWSGRGVQRAVDNVNIIIAPSLDSVEADVHEVDRILCDIDGSENKSKLGANAILPVSLATARAVALSERLPLWRFIADLSGTEPTLPIPMVNMISGGLHAPGNLDMQDFLIIPTGARSFHEALEWTDCIYFELRSLLNKSNMSTLLADEGGFSPALSSHEDALKLLSQSIEGAHFRAGKDIMLAVDVASSHFSSEPGQYSLRSEHRLLDSKGMIELFESWHAKYPIISIEDGCGEEDWKGWVELTKSLGNRVQLVGDDLFATNTKRILKGKELGAANSVLIKLNQAGTLSETLDAITLCRKIGYSPVVSARSGETEDHFIADLAVGTGAGQIKIGSVARSERTAKYNRLLAIEKLESDGNIPFAGSESYPFPNLN